MCTTQVVLQVKRREEHVYGWFTNWSRGKSSAGSSDNSRVINSSINGIDAPAGGRTSCSLLATAGLLETQSTTGVQAVSQTTTARDTEAARGAMAPVTAPTVELTPELRRGAQSFSTNFSIAMDDVLADGDLSKMKPDQMLAAFLKLNIEDPNNSVETHNRLSEVMSELRQRAIDDAKAKIVEAEKMREEAEKYAGVVDMINIVVTSVLMIGAAVLTAATFGIGGFALPAAAAAAISISMALAGVVQAGANLTAAEKLGRSGDGSRLQALAATSR